MFRQQESRPRLAPETALGPDNSLSIPHHLGAERPRLTVAYPYVAEEDAPVRPCPLCGTPYRLCGNGEAAEFYLRPGGNALCHVCAAEHWPALHRECGPRCPLASAPRWSGRAARRAAMKAARGAQVLPALVGA